MWKQQFQLLFPRIAKKRNRTVRYAFPVVLLAALVLGAATIISDQNSFITITATPSSVNKGEQFYLNIHASAHTPVNAIDIVLDYPDAQMQVAGIDVGQSVISLWTEDPYAKNGKIYFRGGTFQKGFLGKHLIARVRMKATESGTAQIHTNNVTFIAGDGLGTKVAVSNSEANQTKIYIKNQDGSLVGSASVVIVTDIDGDGKVTLSDISAFMAAWFTQSKIFDFNGDGKMTFRDFSIILADSFTK